MLAPPRLAELDAFILELNRASADVILPLFRADHGIENKAASGDYDPVTAADKGAEAEIRRLIAQRYPEHGVIGEEMGEDRPDAEFVWVLDPVDGTRAFVAGLPVWTTLIGLRFQGEPVLGSIGQPFLGEVFVGHAGGSRLVTAAGETPLKVRTGAAADRRDHRHHRPGRLLRRRRSWAPGARLRAAARLARLGCDAYAYAMVAAGHDRPGGRGRPEELGHRGGGAGDRRRRRPGHRLARRADRPPRRPDGDRRRPRAAGRGAGGAEAAAK